MGGWLHRHHYTLLSGRTGSPGGRIASVSVGPHHASGVKFRGDALAAALRRA